MRTPTLSHAHVRTPTDAEDRADWLVACALETDAKTTIDAAEPALWTAARQLLGRDTTHHMGLVLALDAVLATEGATTTMVRQIRDALLDAISQQCREEIAAQYRELRQTLPN